MHEKTEILKQAVLEAFQLSWQELLIRNRKYKRVLARKVFICLNQIDLQRGCCETANYFGFNHSTASIHKNDIIQQLSIGYADVVAYVAKVREIYHRKTFENVTGRTSEKILAPTSAGGTNEGQAEDVFPGKGNSRPGSIQAA